MSVIYDSLENGNLSIMKRLRSIPMPLLLLLLLLILLLSLLWLLFYARSIVRRLAYDRIFFGSFRFVLQKQCSAYMVHSKWNHGSFVQKTENRIYSWYANIYCHTVNSIYNKFKTAKSKMVEPWNDQRHRVKIEIELKDLSCFSLVLFLLLILLASPLLSRLSRFCPNRLCFLHCTSIFPLGGRRTNKNTIQFQSFSCVLFVHDVCFILVGLAPQEYICVDICLCFSLLTSRLFGMGAIVQPQSFCLFDYLLYIYLLIDADIT